MPSDGVIQIEKLCPTCHQTFGAGEEIVSCPDDGASLLPVSEDPSVGKVVADKYRIGTLIGTGGYSKVYSARHEQLERAVAFKLLRADLVSNAERIKRFDLEARLASNLCHPHICAVYDCGILANGQPYLILEHLQGTSLSRILQEEGCLEPERAVRLLGQMSLALAHAHERGVVHRDLKPGNVMVVDSESGEAVKIIDFGLAKTFADDDREQLTHTGATIGTPCYMSPEQVRGEAVDCRSDIYSFGCLAYEILTGHKPVHGHSVFETMQGHLDLEPAPMSNGKREIAQDLQDITLRCLRKRPKDRYQSMAEVGEALAAFQTSGRSNKKRGGRAWYRIRNHFSALFRPQQPDETNLLAHFAGQTQQLIVLYSILVPLAVVTAFSPLLFRQPAAKPGKMQEFIQLRKAQNFALAEPLGRKLFARMKASAEQPGPDLIDLCNQMQRMYIEQGRPRDAVPYIKDALEAQTKGCSPGSDAYLRAYADAANAFLAVDDRLALPYLEELAKLVAQKYGANSKEYCHPLYHRAWCKFRSGDAAGSERDSHELVALVPRYYAACDPFNIRSLHRLSVVQLHLGKFRDAQATCDRALPLISGDSPGDLQRDLLQAAAHAAQSCRDYDKAVALYKRALAVSKKVTVVQAEVIQSDLAACLVDAHHYQEAEPILLDALRRVSRRWGYDCDLYQVCLGKYVTLLRATGQTQKADMVAAAGKV
jgi:serine/threonine protein kinase